jgi:hypothetical protein
MVDDPFEGIGRAGAGMYSLRTSEPEEYRKRVVSVAQGAEEAAQNAMAQGLSESYDASERAAAASRGGQEAAYEGVYRGQEATAEGYQAANSMPRRRRRAQARSAVGTNLASLVEDPFA